MTYQGRSFEWSAEKLRRARGGWSVERVAAEIGKSAGTVRNWESGRTVPDVDDLADIASLLGRRLDYFFDRVVA